KGGAAGGTGGKGNGGTGGGSAPACDALDLSFHTTHEKRSDDEDPDHFLIVVTNDGDKACAVYHHPHVWLGDPSDHVTARSAVPAYEGSDPDGPVVLGPGQEAYSGLFAGDIPMDQFETDVITLQTHGRTPGSTGSQPVLVDLPLVVPFDDGARLTGWTTRINTALEYIRS
ncbi:DUF4232 domain-containing protein, partial [Streptomyces sp. UH6]|uniref:DUF4232 domain-containing protein n=1 Tax=Streptomyces sp. UH6 TaxID=2748379 RepID=UPI0015D4B2F9